MEELLIEMINAGISSKTHELGKKVEALSINSEEINSKSASVPEGGSDGDEGGDGGKMRHKLYVQQVKVVDLKGTLKSVYPSRFDLTFGNSNKIRVIRTYDEEKPE